MIAFKYSPLSRDHQRGVALFVGLVFLVVLTLIALVVMKGTLLEMRMTTANARHEQAFEASEGMRAIPEALLVAHMNKYNPGWPASWGGTVPDAMFGLDAIFNNRPQWKTLLKPSSGADTGIQDACGGASLVFFYMDAPPCAGQSDAYNYIPSNWAPAIKMIVCDDGTTGCGANNQIISTISIIRDGVTANQGAGAAAQQGYAGLGVGSANGGAAVLLQIRSDAKVPGNGEAVTMAQYKVNVQ
ncbi:MAG TPA: PilX N-terminal domain-containing pilus assembly protein [Rhodanobacter sp.]